MEHDDSLSWEKVTFSSCQSQSRYYFIFLFVFFFFFCCWLQFLLFLSSSIFCILPCARAIFLVRLLLYPFPRSSPHSSPVSACPRLSGKYCALRKDDIVKRRKKNCENNEASCTFVPLFLPRDSCAEFLGTKTRKSPRNEDSDRDQRSSAMRSPAKMQRSDSRVETLAFRVSTSVMFVDTTRDTRDHCERSLRWIWHKLILRNPSRMREIPSLQGLDLLAFQFLRLSTVFEP